MKARIVSNQTPVGQRSRLASALPLETPYMVQVFPVYACNFKCNYCVFSLPKAERGYVSDCKYLDFELYLKCIRDIRQFPDKLRMLRFAGTGEPLLHPRITDMIAVAAKERVADSIDIVTNGAMLTPELSNKIVEAGVNRIRVSVQGINREKYLATTNTYEDFETIVSNISYLYSIKGNIELYVKIIDSALSGKEDENAFYRTFGDIADLLSIEHLLPATPRIDYSRIAGIATMNKTQNGADIATTDICPQPFYMLQINPDGVAAPCCGMESPLKLAQLADTSVAEVWKGKALNALRRAMLSGCRRKNPVCADCNQFRFAMFPEDVLDGENSRLLQLYSDVPCALRRPA